MLHRFVFRWLLVCIALVTLNDSRAALISPSADSKGKGDRIALVVGNSAYTQSPLGNTVNDARAISELLSKAGFIVSQLLDANQSGMRGAIREFGEKLRDPKVQFAIFYYAGHGIQVDWRNYLIPIDAKVRTAEDVSKQLVDVSDLLRNMESSRNKSFLVVLDACRDNPFADTFKATAKGLSQFDAPVGSLLAYATAPGNVASDGEGKHGLYTSHLLRELEVRNAKIEDAFKRVRLNVRIDSMGKQIPWESTSLEEDLYLFPSDLKKLTDAEREALFEREVSAWRRIRVSSDRQMLINFIREFPSGSTSELAQSRLNRLLRLQYASAEADKATIAKAQADSAMLAEKKAQAVFEANAKAAAETERKALAQLQVRAAEEARLLAEAKAREAKLRIKQEQERVVAEAAKLAKAAHVSERQKREAQSHDALRNDAIKLEQEWQHVAEARHATHDAELASAQELMAKTSEKATDTTVTLDAQATAIAPSPYYKGLEEHVRNYSVGDEYEFRVIDQFTRSETGLNLKVTQVSVESDRVEFNYGEYSSDLMGNMTKNLRGDSDVPRQFYPAELFIGKKWHTKFRQTRSNGTVYNFYYDMKVVAKERVTVPAGTFDAYRLEGEGFNVELGASLQRRIWVTPGINADIMHETLVRLRKGAISEHDRQELVKFSQTKRSANP